MLTIRNYAQKDLPDLYRICLETGNSGADATRLYQFPDLLGAFYAAPYAVFEPELTFVLEDSLGVCGYVLATANSMLFEARMELEWLPTWRTQYPLPDATDTSRDASLIRVIHKGYQANPNLNLEYPAHLHIDLLARAQKKGQGKQLMHRLFAALRAQGVPGVHLGVGINNKNGISFYQHLGFTCLETHPWGLVYGIKL